MITKKSHENANSSNDAADNKEVNGNPVGLSQQYPSQEEMKTFLKGNTKETIRPKFNLCTLKKNDSLLRKMFYKRATISIMLLC